MLNNNKKLISKDHNKEVLVTTLMLLLGTFVFLINSPLHPFVDSFYGTDTHVFQTIALMIEKGFMPYKNSFDHKGPLLFLINFFGVLIDESYGVFTIECVFLLFSFASMYFISRLFCKRTQSIFVFFFSLVLLFSFFEGGNSCEEYAMTFISVSLYIFIDYFKNKRISFIRLMLCGFAFGGTLLLRPNMITLWVVMCFAVLINCVVEKEYKKLIGFVGWFLLGFSLLFIPVLIWLYKNGALFACWNDYIVFNFQYVSYEGISFSQKCKSFLYFFSTPVFLISFASQMIISFREKSCFDYSYLTLMLTTPLFICLSGRTYNHYGMIMVPLVIYPVSITIQKINDFEIDQQKKSTFLQILCAVFIGVVFYSYVNFGYHALIKFKSRLEGNNRPAYIQKICDKVDDVGVGPNDPISVYGNWDLIYVVSRRPHATVYSYQFPIGQVRPSIMEDYFGQLQQELPKAIVVQPGRFDVAISEFLTENDYQLILQENPIDDNSNSSSKEDCALLYVRL